MAKLIELVEAADRLGMTPDELTEARSRNQIFGYRDGATWKFKEAEIERFAAQRRVEKSPDELLASSESSGSLPQTSEVDADLDQLVDVAGLDLDEDQDTDGPESVLVSEEELGESEVASGSTIIGKDKSGSGDGDLLASAGEDAGEDVVDGETAAGSQLKLDVASGSELSLAPSSGILAEDEGDTRQENGSALKLSADSGPSLSSGGSELTLTDGGNSVSPGETGSDLRLAPDSSVGMGSASETGELGGAEDDLILDADTLADDVGSLELGDDELLLETDSVSSLDLESSDISLDLGDETGVNLSDGGSGSDVTLNASDSGINLGSPSDSGISLETSPSELGGSGVEALELGEAEIIDLGDEDVDPEGATQLKADDDFLLTPVEGGAGDDDSGSQVIALDAEEFDETSDTVLAAEAPVMEADPDLATLPEQPAASAAGVHVAALPEAQYSIWNVLGLAMAVVLLGIAGVMMTDLIRNMWSWGQPYTLNSTIMDAITGLLE